MILDQTTIPGGGSGISSKKQYTYVTNNTFFREPQEVDEFDFGASTATRKTVTTYQSFSNSPGQLVSQPCKVVTSDANGNAASETDALYDGAGTVCAAISSGTAPQPVANALPSGTHDPAFESGSPTPRANVTKMIRWLNGGTSPAT